MATIINKLVFVLMIAAFGTCSKRITAIMFGTKLPSLRTEAFRAFYRTSYCFSSKKMQDLLAQLSQRINREQIMKSEAEEDILKNYLQLTEESYLDNMLQKLKQVEESKGKIDPRVILMILPTLEQEATIREHLFALYPYLNALKSKELVLFYEYFLAHPLAVKPKTPRPLTLNGTESLLVLLAEIYPKDSLVDWLGQVPLYNGSNLYVLAMGAFAIISGLSQTAKIKNQSLIERSFERIFQLWSQQNNEARIGAILLALEANLSFAERLILQDYALQFHQIDGLKLGLLLIELDSYLKRQYADITAANPYARQEQDELAEVDIDEGVDRPNRDDNTSKRYVYKPQQKEQVKYCLQLFLTKLIRYMRGLDWTGIVKLHQIVRFYQVLSGKKLEKQWQKFAFKLFNFTTKKQTATSLINLSSDEVISMLQVVEQLKVNKPELIKRFLVLLSDRLEQLSAAEMVRLSKCLVTYVRLCEDYLIHFRLVLQRRKYIFSFEEIQQLNLNFKRVQVLFPKPLVY